MRNIILLFIFIFYFSTITSADVNADYLPLFNKFPATSEFNGIIAKIDFDSHPDSRIFRTRLNQGIKNGPNYSAKYRVIEWGCGTNCTQIAVINVESGKICSWVSTCGASKFSIESRLLIINPGATEGKDTYPAGCSTKFYLLENNKLKQLKNH